MRGVKHTGADDLIETMFREGRKSREIAAVLRIPHGTILRKLGELGLRMHDRDYEYRLAVARLAYLTGKRTARELATATGWARTTAARYLKDVEDTCDQHSELVHRG